MGVVAVALSPEGSTLVPVTDIWVGVEDIEDPVWSMLLVMEFWSVLIVVISFILKKQ
jgi:hypothetical protein